MKLIGIIFSLFIKIVLIIIALWVLRWLLSIIQLNLAGVDLLWLGTTFFVFWILAEFFKG